MSSKIWLSSPHMTNNEQEFISRAFKSNWVSSIGENINEFENSIKKYIGTKSQVVALNSGTSAIHLALILAGVTKGDEVICQSFTFCASAMPIMYLNAIPIFVDSEEETWNMDPYYLEQAVLERIKKGKKPKAIIFVNTYGMPAKINEIISIAKKYNIKLIEDAAASLGSTYINKKCGTFGDYSIISFNGNKIITTSGGGALICKTNKEKEEAIFYATQAKNFSNNYEHSKVGFNYRLSNILAGIGRGQIKVLEKRVAQRRENHSFYKSLFSNSKDITIFKETNSFYYSNHWLSCILIDKEANFNKNDIINELKINNIEARPLWKPLHLQSVFNKFPYYGNKTCVKLFEKGVCLPSGSNMTNLEKNRISNALNKFINL